jgi:Fe-S cluster assembly ATP-binding protein
VKPDIVHVLYQGRIIKTGGPELALELERDGYDKIINEFAPAAAGVEGGA